MQIVHGVAIWNKNRFRLSHNSFHPCFFPPDLPILGPNNELRNLENKGLENDGSKGQLHSTCFIRRNIVHLDHHFATTMQKVSKPTTFATVIFVILCYHAISSIYHYMCVSKWWVQPTINEICSCMIWLQKL